MEKKTTLLDGAVGTSLWELAEARGIDKVPVWKYNLDCPELVTALTRSYLDAGSEILLTNTFGANGPAVRRSSSYTTEEVVSAGVRLAREAVAGSGVKIALAVGPLMTLLEPYGDLSEEECEAIYEEQIGAGMKVGADCIMLQTFMDVEMMRIAATVAKRYGVPVFCTMTFEKTARTMMGNTVKKVVDVLTPVGIDAIGMNCSLGPDLALPVIREFAGLTDLPLIFKPNAGKPILAADGTTVTDYDAATFARDVAPALEYVSYIGGCCGCNPAYIRELKKYLS